MNTNKKPVANSSNGRGDYSRSTSYRDGYIHGQNSECDLQEETRVREANNNAANGLLTGVALTVLLGLVGGTAFFLTQRPEPTAPTIVPVPASNSNTPTQSKQNTTIIERTIEKTKEVAPSPQPSTPPQININVPASPSSQPQAPEAQSQSAPAASEPAPNNQAPATDSSN